MLLGRLLLGTHRTCWGGSQYLSHHMLAHWPGTQASCSLDIQGLGSDWGEQGDQGWARIDPSLEVALQATISYSFDRDSGTWIH